MKKTLLSIVFSGIIYLANAQSQFGIISYTLTEGWYTHKSGGDLEILKKGMEGSNCKIILLQPVDGATTTEAEYNKLLKLKTSAGNEKAKPTAPPLKTDGDEWISFSGYSVVKNNTGKYTEGFYTLSDDKKTAIILAMVSDNTCMEEADKILSSITITEGKDAITAKKSKAKKVRILPLKSLKALVN